MSAAVLPLPTAWVERIFNRLNLAYGRDFLGRWEGMPLDAVKADWADCLAGFAQNPDAIAHALAHLPDSKPPTAQEFRALCLRAPAKVLPALPEPLANPQRVAAELAALDKVRTSQPGGMKDWACRLRDREATGDRLNPYQRHAYRVALGLEA